jgi:hypothetical protein
MIRSLLLCVVVVLGGCFGNELPGWTDHNQEPPLQVFILAGQSNMHGADALIDTASGTKDLVDMRLQKRADRSCLLTVGGFNVYPLGDVRGHDTIAVGQKLAPNGLPYKGHGPEVGFCRAMGGRVALVKYSANYFALENGRSAWVSPGSRWNALVEFIETSLEAIEEPYEIAGFLWFQGYDDGVHLRSQEGYEADLTQIASDLRARYGDHPFILARTLNVPDMSSQLAPIRAGQVAVADRLESAAWIDADDLTPYVERVHLSSASQLIVGQRFARAYKRLADAR